MFCQSVIQPGLFYTGGPHSIAFFDQPPFNQHQKDTRFEELREYLCDVRAKQFWKIENLKSFDEFLEKRFPDSRRKAYYSMAIHENRTRHLDYRG